MRLAGIPRAPGFPRMARIQQQFPGPTLLDVRAAVRQALGDIALPVRPGQSVALAVGSRGIVNIDAIVRATVDSLKERGAHPFIFSLHRVQGWRHRRDQGYRREHPGLTSIVAGTSAPFRSSMPRNGLTSRTFRLSRLEPDLPVQWTGYAGR
jgi:hypothetical protein